MGKSQRRLRNYLLQPLLQTKIGFYCIILSSFFSGTIAFVLYVHLSKYADIVLQLTDAEEGVRELFRGYIQEVQLWILLLAVTYLLATILVSIVYTHKLVGPTFAFRRHIHSLRTGNFKVKTFLRKNDAFKEVADELNRLSDALDSKFGK